LNSDAATKTFVAVAEFDSALPAAAKTPTLSAARTKIASVAISGVRFINEPFREWTDDDEGSNGIEARALGGELEDPVGEQHGHRNNLGLPRIRSASRRSGFVAVRLDDDVSTCRGHPWDDDSEARAEDDRGPLNHSH